MINPSISNDGAAEEFDELIAKALSGGVDRGEGRGKCHVFRESDVCVCGEVDLSKARMR